MGVFADHAASYTEKGFKVFPTGKDTGKVPLIRGWQKVGKKAAIALAKQFPDANIGVIDGDKVTRVDIDDPELIDGAIRRFGDSPVKVGTPSGGLHLWFAANGERRRTSLNGQKLDILGKGGYGVAPPSVNPHVGVYRFLEGSLDDVDRIPTIREGALPPEIYSGDTAGSTGPKGNEVPGMVSDGGRTIAMYDELRKIAFLCETVDELAFKGAGINEVLMDPPLTDAEVMKQALGVWKLKTEGRLILPGSGGVVIGRDEGAKLYGYAPSFSLWHYLKSNHGPEHEFAICSVGLAKVLPNSVPTITKARKYLLETGYIRQTHIGGGDGNPHRFRFLNCRGV